MRLPLSLTGVVSVLLLGLMGFISSAVASNSPAALRDLEQRLSGLTSFSANFDQQVQGQGNEQLNQNFRGHFTMKRPNRFRWEVKGPEAQLIIADGKRLWVYDKELEQVQVSPLSEQLGDTPALLLSGDTTVIARTFMVDYLVNLSSRKTFVLTPKDKSQFLKLIEITFEGSQLQGMRFQDGLDQITELRFTGVKSNISLDDAQFKFKVPAGVDVLGNP